MRSIFIAHFLFCLLSISPCNVKQSIKLPVREGNEGFLVTIGFGKEHLSQTLLIDTGSALTWIQCKPCDECYEQEEPIFDPSLSSTYADVKFDSHECEVLLPAATGNDPERSETGNCLYTATYKDESSSQGTLAKDIVSLPGGTEKTIYFGCGRTNKALDGVEQSDQSGILGLGAELSFPSQISGDFSVFSYCLPSSRKEVGYLTFEPTDIPESIRYTEMVYENTNQIELDGITFDGKDLDIPLTVYAKVDTGSFLTHLPPEVYAQLKKSFMSKMAKYPPAPALGPMDTCYDLTEDEYVDIPSVEFHFSDGVTVKGRKGLAQGVVFIAKWSQACLAFVGNKDDDDDVLFGSFQHRTHLVVFDPLEKKIGFAPNGCK